MKYRTIGNTGIEASVLGFGCMRFPMLGQPKNQDQMLDPDSPVDMETSERLLRTAYEKGINYFDTAYPYIGGRSEGILGKVVKDFRKDICIADKMPPWNVNEASDLEKIFNEQLERLETDYIDFYLLHSMARIPWEKFKKLGALEFLTRAKKEGRIRFAGFSFHDDINTFKEIVDGYDWDMCQIQYNFFDVNFQAGKEGLRYAADKGLGVVIMEPLRGGKLTERVPEPVKALWDTAPVKRSPAEWCLKFVLDHPEVSLVLSGMSAMDQLDENVKIASETEPCDLTKEEHDIIAKVRETYEGMLKIPCTGCSYCMPCPSGVNIPFNFSLYNDTFMFFDPEVSRRRYNIMLTPDSRAEACVECGQCMEHCPQGINIPEELKNVSRQLTAENNPTEF